MVNNCDKIFFFSENCQHCIEAYELIKKIGVSYFLFVNVDKDVEKIPQFIDRVPCILTKDNKCIVEEGLFTYLNEQLNIEPYMINEMGNTLSDKYSYMDDSGVTMNHVYQFLDKDSEIITPTEEDSKKIINYEQIIKERDQDLQRLNA